MGISCGKIFRDSLKILNQVALTDCAVPSIHVYRSRKPVDYYWTPNSLLKCQ